jgi:biopolymer transport protein TolQ
MDSSLSIFSLIINAGLVVQFVMLVLVLMSIYSWTIITSKKRILLDAKRASKAFNTQFVTSNTLEDLYADSIRQPSAIERVFVVGYDEFTQDETNTTQDKILDAERAYRAMNTAINVEVDELDKNLSVLAMIASASPYIGLFGTVWGIMHSFIGLASIKQATIAIVAPGIAEALIATAFGLFAAIPATIAYNRLSTQVSEIHNQYTIFSEKLFVVLQR